MTRNVLGFSHLHGFIGLAATVILLGCATAFVPLDAKKVSFYPAAVGVENVERLVSKIADAVKIQAWLFRRKSGTDVFKKLKIGGGKTKLTFENVLADPNLMVLDRYLTKFNKKYPKHKKSLFEILKEQYDEKTIAGILVEAKDEKLTTKLQNQQFDSWIANDKPIHKAFDELELVHAGTALFTSREMKAFQDFLKYQLKVTNLKYQDLGIALSEGFGEANYANLLFKWFEQGVKPKDLRKITRNEKDKDHLLQKRITKWYTTLYKGFIQKRSNAVSV